jgi:AcrR family transcriptional regulator
MTIKADRRRTILDAALRCFLDKGYAATSMADIRARSGASTGSIYHFFAGKSALAEALLDEAVAGWGAASATAQDPDAPAEHAIKASVRGLCLWGLAHPERSRFLEELRNHASSSPEFAAVRSKLENGQEAGAARYALWVEKGEVRELPWPVAYALMLGPVYTFLRVGRPLPQADADDIAGLFAEAAWHAVRS